MKICEVCNSEIIVRKPSQLKFRVVRFCSRQCYYKSQKGRQITWGSKISKTLTGRKLSPQHVQALVDNHVGTRGWKKPNAVTSEHTLIRKSPEYKKWRTAVFERDDYTCQNCGQRGGILNADHIKPFSLYPDLRLMITNGRTLCEDCHKLTPTYGKWSKKCLTV